MGLMTRNKNRLWVSAFILKHFTLQTIPKIYTMPPSLRRDGDALGPKEFIDGAPNAGTMKRSVLYGGKGL